MLSNDSVQRQCFLLQVSLRTFNFLGQDVTISDSFFRHIEATNNAIWYSEVTLANSFVHSLDANSIEN
jgi:hypothetical protein